MTTDAPENDPEYAAAAALWNGMSQQSRTELLRLVLRLQLLVAEEERLGENGSAATQPE